MKAAGWQPAIPQSTAGCQPASSGLVRRDMKSLTEVAASLLLALVLLRLSGSLVDIIYEWKLRAGKF